MTDNHDVGVPDDQDVDEPFPDVVCENGDIPHEHVPMATNEPSLRDLHKWKVEQFKNDAALKIVAYCLISIMILALIGVVPKVDDDLLDKASDVFKLVGTTALGYLFGRNMGDES